MLKRFALALVMVCLSLGTAAPAAADFRATDDRPEFISLTTMTSTAVVVGVIMLSVVSAKKNPTALNRYLRQNEPAVRAAAALGAGAALDDIAAMFGVQSEHSAAFGRLLRRHRTALLDAAFAQRDIDVFIQIVETGMRMDPQLRVAVDGA